MATQSNKTKRTLVRNDDISVEVQDTKRRKLDLDIRQKENCLRAIGAAHVLITTYCGLSLSNLHDGAQVANIIKAIFTFYRQRANASGGLVSKHQAKPFTITIKGEKKEIQREQLSVIVVALWEQFGLVFTKPRQTDRNWWWGTFLPLLTYCCAWEHRLTELRIGHSRFTRKKEMRDLPEGGQERIEREVQVKDFGLLAQHHILLEGVTFPPEMRASMAQSVGPMTSIIALCNEKGDNQYTKKYRDAAARVFAHIPNIESIIGALAGQRAQDVSTLVRVLADICCIVPARNQRRAFFPINWLTNYCLTPDDIKHYTVKHHNGIPTNIPTTLSEMHLWYLSGVEPQHETGKKRSHSPTAAERVKGVVKSLISSKSTPTVTEGDTDVEMEESETPAPVDPQQQSSDQPPMRLPERDPVDEEGKQLPTIWWDHSGKGAALVYKKCQSRPWVLPKGAGATVTNMSQAVFHSIWGSYSEDFSLLAWQTTEQNWGTRKEFGNFMEGYGSSKETISIELPVQLWYSKLAGANLTQMLTEQSEQMSVNPVWAGLRETYFTQALIDSFETSTTTAKHHGKDITTLASELSIELADLKEKNAALKKFFMGTVKWKRASGNEPRKGVDGEETTHVPSLSNRFFLAR